LCHCSHLGFLVRRIKARHAPDVNLANRLTLNSVDANTNHSATHAFLEESEEGRRLKEKLWPAKEKQADATHPVRFSHDVSSRRGAQANDRVAEKALTLAEKSTLHQVCLRAYSVYAQSCPGSNLELYGFRYHRSLRRIWLNGQTRSGRGREPIFPTPKQEHQSCCFRTKEIARIVPENLIPPRHGHWTKQPGLVKARRPCTSHFEEGGLGAWEHRADQHLLLFASVLRAQRRRRDEFRFCSLCVEKNDRERMHI
jgi:hypothetical protein